MLWGIRQFWIGGGLLIDSAKSLQQLSSMWWWTCSQMTGGHIRDAIGRLLAITVSIARPGHPDACSCAPLGLLAYHTTLVPAETTGQGLSHPIQKCDIHMSIEHYRSVNCCSWLLPYLGTSQRQKVIVHTTCQSCIMKIGRAHV